MEAKVLDYFEEVINTTLEIKMAFVKIFRYQPKPINSTAPAV